MAGLVPFNRRNGLLRPGNFNDFYNMLDDFFSDTLPSRNLLSDSFKIDVKENENQYCIEAELPGIKKEEINLDLNEGRLSISVERKENIEEKKDNYIHRERRYGSMSRSVYLADVKPESVKAHYKDGILEITVQKEKRSDKNTKIEIQ